MHFAKEFDGFRFVAWFARIFGRDNLLDINRHDQPICLDQSRPLHSLAWYTHASALVGGVVVIQKINGDEFRYAGFSEVAPNRSAFPAVGKRKAVGSELAYIIHCQSTVAIAAPSGRDVRPSHPSPQRKQENAGPPYGAWVADSSLARRACMGVECVSSLLPHRPS